MTEVTCRHNDDERSLIGTWVSIELMKAVEKGYKVVELHEVWHFQRTKVGMFREYVDTFLKLKVENSGLPEWVKDERDEAKYRDLYKEHEGIVLGNIQKNTGMRWLAKLLLNSFWGKFGQRPNLPVKVLVSSLQELWARLNDTSLEFTLCHMDDDAAELSATNKSRANKTSRKSMSTTVSVEMCA